MITEPKLCFDLDLLLRYAERLLKAQASYESRCIHFDRVFRVNREMDPTLRVDRLRAEEIHRLLIASGFRDVTMTDSHVGQCATIIATKPTNE